MKNTDKEKFESLWNDFAVLVKGKLISTSKNQHLSTPLANLILKEAAASWSSEYEICGKWMYELKDRKPQEAELIQEIFLNDMKFKDVPVKKEFSRKDCILIPAIGAILGLGISHFSGAGKWTQAISTIIPAVLLYPAVKKFGERLNSTNRSKVIEDYMGQLDKYRNSILTILS